MLLTLTLTRPPATDLGFLLHKHPDRIQRFSLPFGAAHVFYQEADEQRCTASLLLDIDPVGLVRRGVRFSLLDQYVNDRPYVASSFMSVALGRVLRATANLAVDTTDPESERAATRWWTELTESGGEGMVVKPLEFIARGRRGL